VPSAAPSIAPTAVPTVPTAAPTVDTRTCAALVDGKCACPVKNEPPIHCLPGFFGAKCEQCPDCGFGGWCKDGATGDGKCTCFPGFEGDTCEKCVKGYTKCADGHCSKRKCPGTACGETTHAGPYSGDNPTECARGSTCEFKCRTGGTTCSNCWQGDCICDPFKATPPAKPVDCAECPQGTFGPNCVKATVQASDCMHGKIDSGKDGTGKCKCIPGYAGLHCDICEKGYFRCSATTFEAVDFKYTGKFFCSELRCTGHDCGYLSFMKDPTNFNFQCRSNKCEMSCEKTFFNKCEDCHLGNCKCAAGGDHLY